MTFAKNAYLNCDELEQIPVLNNNNNNRSLNEQKKRNVKTTAAILRISKQGQN